MPRRPDPEPFETNDVLIVAGGTAVWALALVVLGVARLSGAGVHGWWLWMCVAGVVLGLWGVRTCRRRPGRATTAEP